MAATIPDEFLDLMAEKFRMLADSTRLAILRALMQGERNVRQVVDETGRRQANVSKHLKMLAESGLVARRKEGLQVFYRIEDPLVERLCELVCETIVQEAQQDVERQRKAARRLEWPRAEHVRGKAALELMSPTGSGDRQKFQEVSRRDRGPSHRDALRLVVLAFVVPRGRPRLAAGVALSFGCFNSATQSFAARAPSTIPPTSALFVGIDLAMNATGNTVPYENEYDIVYTIRETKRPRGRERVPRIRLGAAPHHPSQPARRCPMRSRRSEEHQRDFAAATPVSGHETPPFWKVNLGVIGR